MNRRPIAYLQTDPRWAALPYRVPGERATIGGSGCGPTAAAMLIETLTGKTFTPVDACAWSVEHGYKALNQGTYYSYFVPQFAEFGIPCGQLSWVNTYGKPDHESQIYDSNTYVKEYTYLGIVGKQDEQGRYATEQRNKFSVGEEIEVMKPDGDNIAVTVKGIWDEEGNLMESAPHPKQKLWIDLGVEMDEFDILRRKEMEEKGKEE